MKKNVGVTSMTSMKSKSSLKSFGKTVVITGCLFIGILALFTLVMREYFNFYYSDQHISISGDRIVSGNIDGEDCTLAITNQYSTIDFQTNSALKMYVGMFTMPYMYGGDTSPFKIWYTDFVTKERKEMSFPLRTQIDLEIEHGGNINMSVTPSVISGDPETAGQPINGAYMELFLSANMQSNRKEEAQDRGDKILCDFRINKFEVGIRDSVFGGADEFNIIAPNTYSTGVYVFSRYNVLYLSVPYQQSPMTIKFRVTAEDQSASGDTHSDEIVEITTSNISFVDIPSISIHAKSDSAKEEETTISVRNSVTGRYTGNNKANSFAMNMSSIDTCTLLNADGVIHQMYGADTTERQYANSDFSFTSSSESSSYSENRFRVSSSEENLSYNYHGPVADAMVNGKGINKSLIVLIQENFPTIVITVLTSLIVSILLQLVSKKEGVIDTERECE